MAALFDFHQTHHRAGRTAWGALTCTHAAQGARIRQMPDDLEVDALSGAAGSRAEMGGVAIDLEAIGSPLNSMLWRYPNAPTTYCN
jgi:hypothetical protein